MPKVKSLVIPRGVSTSVAELSRKLMKYVRAYAKSARPIRWTYTNPKRRITGIAVTGTTH